MEDAMTFVIKYDPLESTVNFSICTSDGREVDIVEGEELKDYENNQGVFNLDGHKEKVLKYITENFDGESSVLIRLIVPQLSYDKTKNQFDLFEQSLEKFNENSSIHLQMQLDIISLMKDDPKHGGELSENSIRPFGNVAVVGKIGSGKTELINALINNSENGKLNKNEGFIKYTDTEMHSYWYEIEGIEIEKFSINRTNSIISRLVREHGVKVILYCLRSRTGKIEDIERDFIVDLKHEFPALEVFAVVTESIDEESANEFAQKISVCSKNTKTFVVLARELRCKAGYLQPFGLDELKKEVLGSMTQ